MYKKIGMEVIDPPDQADRIDISEETVMELAASIKEVGLLSPILVARRGDRYEIVFGHRRFLACQRLGKKTIMAQEKELSPQEVSVLRATENIQREDLTPIEEGRLYKRMMEELGMTMREVCEKTARTPGVVKRRIDMLKMPESFQKALHARKVGLAVAEELWSCPDADYREYLLEMAVEHGVTKAVARQWVDDYRKRIRTEVRASEGGGHGVNVPFQEKIYRSCDACQGPIEIADIQELRLCPQCYEQIMAAIRGERS